MNLETIAESINILGEFCGKRDVNELSHEALLSQYKFSQADVLILFGGSIPYGFDIVGKAVIQHISKTFMIVGGEGHTTESLRQKMKKACPQIETEGKMEADIIQDYLKYWYDIDDCLIERDSSNCGNNVTNSLAIMKHHHISPQNIIIVQDATMQRRMEAGFRKYLNPEIEIINFASYRAKIIVRDGILDFEPSNFWGMWDVQQYVTLLMGEIPRLTDNQDGYGPNGKNYIVHVDIPQEVINAFTYLKKEYGNFVRTANPLYRTK
jgi:Uncharacterized conserved protein